MERARNKSLQRGGYGHQSAESQGRAPARRGRKGKYDFVVSRAVMQLPDLMKIIKKTLRQKGQNALPNGLLCLKGGNLKEELKQYFKISEITPLSTFFDEEWFSQDKQLVYVPA